MPLLFYIVAAWVFSGVATAMSFRAVRAGKRSRFTVLLMFLSFVAQSMVLSQRGELRGQCPLGDMGEIVVFLAWSMSIFYLIIGSTYRLSLLGLFSAPVVTLSLLVATIPGVFEASPARALVVEPWYETHAALSVLSYGAFALAAIAGVMFRVLNRRLKMHETNSGLFANMPPVTSLIASMVRLTGVGTLVLTGGVLCAMMMPHETESSWLHFWVAVLVWLAYTALLTIWQVRGMTPSRMASSVVLMFVLSLLVFAVL
ncbi:cytochrome c biogenesis protein CcsA [Rubritalea marina]|uniref:cytochrome c biogenesis protein CcsA n=1 Tax=Rubritalea marina TaxID=361055 RepID=UPI0003728F37|nr:cytochrome c biogenesis protein CcsA [Rubritalea marina]